MYMYRYNNQYLTIKVANNIAKCQINQVVNLRFIAFLYRINEFYTFKVN